MNSVVCRTCMEKSNKDFVNLFDHQQNNTVLSEMLNKCATLETHRNDGLPILICNDCVKLLTSAWKFRLMAIHSDSKLRCSSVNLVNNNTVTAKVQVRSEAREIAKIEEIDRLVQESNVADSLAKNDNADHCGSNITEDDESSHADLNNDDFDLSYGKDSALESNCNTNESTRDYSDVTKTNNKNHRTLENVLLEYKDGRKLTRKEKAKLSIFCKECNRSFGYKYYVEEHLRRHNGDEPFKCKDCGKCFVRRFQLNLHSRVHTGERPYSCEICGKAFKFVSAIKAHKFVHSEERPHKCPHCEKLFKHEFALSAHIRTHSKEKVCTCEICGKSFTDPSILYSHKDTHATEAEKIHSCSECSKSFASNSRLKEHMKRHSSVKPHQCTHCDKSFKDKTVLKMHMLRHTGEKPHSCTICKKDFRHPSTLYLHMRTHTGETPYSCEVCHSKFKYSHHLKNHMKVHA